MWLWIQKRRFFFCLDKVGKPKIFFLLSFLDQFVLSTQLFREFYYEEISKKNYGFIFNQTFLLLQMLLYWLWSGIILIPLFCELTIASNKSGPYYDCLNGMENTRWLWSTAKFAANQSILICLFPFISFGRSSDCLSWRKSSSREWRKFFDCLRKISTFERFYSPSRLRRYHTSSSSNFESNGIWILVIRSQEWILAITPSGQINTWHTRN